MNKFNLKLKLQQTTMLTLKSRQALTKKVFKKCPTAKYVDNKRKMQEKSLFASQRVQVHLNLSRYELKMKQSMVDELMEATRQSNKTILQVSSGNPYSTSEYTSQYGISNTSASSKKVRSNRTKDIQKLV